MKKSTIHFITGGQRSGKSIYAEKQTLQASNCPTYLATSKIWDKELKTRIDIHKARRDDQWTTYEEEIEISKIISVSGVVLLDCITLWLTNIFDREEYDKEKTIAFAKKEWLKLCKKNLKLIVVSNEIGMGLVPIEQSSRTFIDIQGTMNQFIAEMADEVTFIVSGLPLEVKRLKEKD